MEISASYKKQTPFYALIAAGGSGLRLGGEVPKQYQKINGKSILRHTLDVFLSCPGLQGICVVINPAHKDLYNDAVRGLDLPAPIEGGNDRKKSIINGLHYFSNLKNEDAVLIHDAARPLVSHTDIMAVALSAQNTGATTLAIPVSDTQKYSSGDYVDRKDLWSIQTPQGFHYGIITQAHEQASNETEYTDDTSLVAAMGKNIDLVSGSRCNIKITTQDDLTLAEKLLAPPAYETRTGFGCDVHAFTDGGNVRLCGVDIPHDKSLKGHSDADVALHALTDALLGTIGGGDIGLHFPPSDPQWKNADSALFLQKAVDMVKLQKGRISNLDLTIICEAPKITPYRDAMQARIADICGIDISRVNIKATTTEKLGFTGRGEGIAAQAVASVLFPVRYDNV